MLCVIRFERYLLLGVLFSDYYVTLNKKAHLCTDLMIVQGFRCQIVELNRNHSKSRPQHCTVKHNFPRC